jgi:hypothetical protein
MVLDENRLYTSVRFFFAFSEADECNGDFATVVALDAISHCAKHVKTASGRCF